MKCRVSYLSFYCGNKSRFGKIYSYLNSTLTNLDLQSHRTAARKRNIPKYLGTFHDFIALIIIQHESLHFYLIYPHLAHCTAEVCTEAFGSLELAVYIEVREDERVCLFCSDSLSQYETLKEKGIFKCIYHCNLCVVIGVDFTVFPVIEGHIRCYIVILVIEQEILLSSEALNRIENISNRQTAVCLIFANSLHQ